MQPVAPSSPRSAAETATTVEGRFNALVQSPLRSALLRYLHLKPEQSFDAEGLVEVLVQLPRDIENCLRDLMQVGLVARLPGEPPRFTARRSSELAPLLDRFLEQSVRASAEDVSPAAGRFREMIGRDEKMLLVFDSIRMAAKAEIPVLLLGPTGSGKEVAARMIHELSRRRAGRMEALNCAALPDTLFESEMFGYEKGAFTGAAHQKRGRVELAHEGTLFLDEVGDLSPMGQVKLLRVLAERRFERLGSHRSIDVDFRLISATNRSLEELVRAERFREDLYYRVNAFSIRLPSLRERAVDIPVLAARFLRRHCAAHGRAPDEKSLSAEALALLTSYHWPGNIRELENTIARAALAAEGPEITGADVRFLELHDAGRQLSGPGLASLASAERVHIRKVLDATGWNKKEAARILEIGRATLYRKIQEYGLEREPAQHELARAS